MRLHLQMRRSNPDTVWISVSRTNGYNAISGGIEAFCAEPSENSRLDGAAQGMGSPLTPCLVNDICSELEQTELLKLYS